MLRSLHVPKHRQMVVELLKNLGHHPPPGGVPPLAGGFRNPNLVDRELCGNLDFAYLKDPSVLKMLRSLVLLLP